MKKQIPNIITVTRFLFSISMIFTQTLSVPFFVLYTLGGLTDALDGFLARKLDACSKTGSILDSVADVAFFVISLIKVLCAVSIPIWLIICLLFITVLKIVNLIVGFVTQHKLVMPHTIPNKITGFLIFLAPYALLFLDISYVAIPVCAVAVFAAVHEGIVI